MTFDRAKFSISKDHLFGNRKKKIVSLDSKLKCLSGFLNYECSTETIVNNKPVVQDETYNIRNFNHDKFPHDVGEITLKSINIMKIRQFDKLLECLSESKIRLINARFYLTDNGFKDVVNWLTNSDKAYMDLASDMFRYHDHAAPLTKFSIHFQSRRDSGMLVPDDRFKKIYVTTIRTMYHNINTNDSINILQELKNHTYFLRE